MSTPQICESLRSDTAEDVLSHRIREESQETPHHGVWVRHRSTVAQHGKKIVPSTAGVRRPYTRAGRWDAGSSGADLAPPDRYRSNGPTNLALGTSRLGLADIRLRH